MTKLNCTTTQCEFNKEKTCSLDAIEINFTDDEYRYASCSNFKESKKFQRQHYTIVPISIIPNYKYIIFSMSCESITVYLGSIIEDLKSQYNEIGKVNILIDNLLHNGSSVSNRYIECVIDFDDMDLVMDKLYFTPKNSELRQFSADFYKQYPELIEYSILTSVQKKMILKGLGI